MFSAFLPLSRSASTNSLKSLIDSFRPLKIYVALVKAFHTDLYHLRSLRALSGSQPLPWSCWSGKEYKNRRYYSSSTFLALISNSFFCNNSDRAVTSSRETCFMCCRMKFNCCSCGTNFVLDFFRLVVRERFSVPGWRIPRFLTNNSLETNFSLNLSHNGPTSKIVVMGIFQPHQRQSYIALFSLFVQKNPLNFMKHEAGTTTMRIICTLQRKVTNFIKDLGLIEFHSYQTAQFWSWHRCWGRKVNFVICRLLFLRSLKMWPNDLLCNH